MADLGFGSSTSTAGPPGQAQVFDHGFGSPWAWSPDSTPETASGEGDTGFGSPSWTTAFVVAGATGLAVLPDEGGAVLELAGTWPEEGPYQVRLVAADGSEIPASGGAYSARVGHGDGAMANAAKDTLLFAAPPSPPGLYGVVVRWGPELAYEQVVPNAVLVVRRLRCPATYRLRRRLQPLYTGRGPVSAQRERLLE